MTIYSIDHNTLIHRAITKIAPSNSYRSIRYNLFALPLAVVASVGVTALSSCDGVVYEPTLGGMEKLYNESCGLKGVSSDSVQRFAAKVQAYINRFPEVQKNPDYYSILGNIEEPPKPAALLSLFTSIQPGMVILLMYIFNYLISYGNIYRII